MLVLFKYNRVEIVITVLFLIQTAFYLSRLELLESQLSQLELFDQALLTLTQKSENFLSGLRSTSQVDVADLEVAITKLKVRNQQFDVHYALWAVTVSKFILITVVSHRNLSN